MREKFTAFSEYEQRPKLRDIYRVRGLINEQRRFDLNDTIALLVQDLRKDAEHTFGTTRPLQKIEMYQALIGGSPEGEDENLGEFRAMVEEKIAALVAAIDAELSTNDSSERS